MTNGLNAIADGLRLSPEFSAVARVPLLEVTDDEQAPAATRAVFREIQAFYAVDRTPAVFRSMARDGVFLEAYWTAVREAFTDRTLDRLTKEVLAFAASFSGKSDYGIDFHLREARRLGLSERGLTEALQVIQCFSTVTKIADALQLQPDFDPAATT